MSAFLIKSEGTETERQSVYRWLREFNEAKNGDFMRWASDGGESPVFLVATRDASVIGGLEGTIAGKWIKINVMAVAPEHRRRGVGARLVEAALDLGENQGCEFAYVDTMSYQANEFYERLGFEVVGRLTNWDSHGHDKIFMRMIITASTTRQ